ncbi:hypothetical protein TPHA_0F02330 [Tetrapisispora phaffii CBS 4417]|uniref:Uncharacterized protein n=1 Tax=Tetrapisispora phaffii (strain ATCC 24235 / CBS 4417 / NBRC 1672 / NRRL Y-8282 / UCD 70-5) TaxID=1071381 RepID=G8BUC8_TETPH|nr:hypothetical protein TPHA_0F02330 [Tetrapisispora phaffii CBS 4417]CCE63714.1 hypothetical protein TPHA_0F02330 [Tetrapisispora phaffii CBS 4417]
MKSVKCVVIGDGGVGKSSLLISYTTNTFPQDYVPTVFDNYSTTVAINDTDSGEDESDTQLFKLNLWDTAGQEEYDTLRPLSYPQTDIFLICFSVEDQAAFSNARSKWYNEVLGTINLKNSAIYKVKNKYPILLVGTKSDLRENEATREALEKSNSSFITKEEIDGFINDTNILGYVECSAATQTGVSNVFETAVRHNILKVPGLDESLNGDQSSNENKSSIKDINPTKTELDTVIESSHENTSTKSQKSVTENIPNDRQYKSSELVKKESEVKSNNNVRKDSNDKKVTTPKSSTYKKTVVKNKITAKLKKVPTTKQAPDKNKNCIIV